MRPLLLSILLVLPALAEARPCQLPDAARSYLAAATSPLVYAVVHGSFETDRATGALVEPFRLTGQRLTQSGFTTPFSEPVSYVFTCPAQMEGCPTFIAAPEPARGPILAFLEITDSGYVLTEQGCWSETVVPAPTAHDLAVVTACLQGAACAPSN